MKQAFVKIKNTKISKKSVNYNEQKLRDKISFETSGGITPISPSNIGGSD